MDISLSREPRHPGAMKHFAHRLTGIKSYYLLLVPLALLMFPHKGIVHDTRLYVFDILNIARDGVFAGDFLAVAGVQNQFTLFSHLAAPLYAVASPWVATSLVFAVGQIVWFSGLVALVAKFTEDRDTAFYGLLSAFLLPTAYFGFSVLSYGEPFATPRLFAEGLTFWALWSFFSRRYLLSSLAVLLGFALHPIMGLIAAALLVAMLLQESWRWWWIFGGVAVVGAAAIIGSGVVPLRDLAATLDGDWLRVVQLRAKYLYVSQWPVKDWARILLAVSVTVPLIALFTGRQRQLIISAWIVGAAGLAVSLVGTDLLHNVLLSQVQTSRSVWFVYLLGNVGLGVVVANLYRKTEADGDAFLILYVLAWSITHIFVPLLGLALGLVASTLAYLRLTDRIAGIPSLFRRLIYLTAFLLFSALLFFRAQFWAKHLGQDGVLLNSGGFLGIGGFTQMELIFVAFAIFAVARLRVTVPSYVVKSLLVLLTLWSVLAWDRRSLENRGLEGDYNAEALLEHIPPGAQVYWESDSKGTWFLLGRPSYVSGTQGAGSVFSKSLALEFLRRSQIAKAIDGVDYVDIWDSGNTLAAARAQARELKQLSRSDIVAACTNASELDFMLLTRAVDDLYLTVWFPRTGESAAAASGSAPALAPTQPWFLYRCADFR